MVGRRGSELIVPQGIAVGQPYLLLPTVFFGKMYRFATLHTFQTTERRQTDTTSYHISAINTSNKTVKCIPMVEMDYRISNAFTNDTFQTGELRYDF